VVDGADECLGCCVERLGAAGGAAEGLDAAGGDAERFEAGNDRRPPPGEHIVEVGAEFLVAGASSRTIMAMAQPLW